MKKIIVIGTSASGKTTLATRLAGQFKLKLIDLDEYFWLENWTTKSKEDFHQSIRDAIASKYWVVSGNYNSTFHLTWPEADTIIWLNYPDWLIYWRFIKRTFDRVILGQRCCNGNKESLSRSFGPHSLIWWIFKTKDRNRLRYGEIFESGIEGKNLVEIKSPQEVEKLFN